MMKRRAGPGPQPVAGSPPLEPATVTAVRVGLAQPGRAGAALCSRPLRPVAGRGGGGCRGLRKAAYRRSSESVTQ
jgi:hypothetical protein